MKKTAQIGTYHVEIPGHPGIFVAANLWDGECRDTDSAAVEAAKSYLRSAYAAPAMLAALKRASAAPGPFADSHSPYWTINEDEMAEINAAIARAEAG